MQTPNANGEDICVGTGPVKSLKRYHSRLYVACGNDILVMKISDRTVEKKWTVIEQLVRVLSYCMCTYTLAIYISRVLALRFGCNELHDIA